MAKNDLNDLIKKLDRVQNHLGEEIAPAVNKLLKESVSRSLIDWYNDYDPEDYKRTYNFMRILDIIIMLQVGIKTVKELNDTSEIV